MSEMAKIFARQNEIQSFIKELNTELQEIESMVQNYIPESILSSENNELSKVVQKLKEELIRLEIANGIKQIPLLNTEKESSEVILQNPNNSGQSEIKRNDFSAAKDVKETNITEGKKKIKSEKLVTKKQESKKQGGESKEEPPVDVGRLDLRVGKLTDVKSHPDADSLYIEQVDVGQEKPLTVISGLVKHVPIEEMYGRMVVLLCNLKPVKMRGITSEAMVMCASTPERVEILSPPSGAVPGDLVHVEGYTRVPDVILNPKKKIFETVAPDLKTDLQCRATYKGALWTVPGKGNVSSQSLTDVNIK